MDLAVSTLLALREVVQPLRAWFASEADPRVFGRLHPGRLMASAFAAQGAARFQALKDTQNKIKKKSSY